MLAQLRPGIAPSQCQAKIFGGGNMFPAAGAARRQQRRAAQRRSRMRAAAQFGIPIVSESLFGIGHRQIIFDVGNGDVWSRQVKPIAQEAQASTRGQTPVKRIKVMVVDDSAVVRQVVAGC
jgi:chemotaxis protein CheD